MRAPPYRVRVSTPFKNVTWVCANCPVSGDNADAETAYMHSEAEGHTVKVLTVSITTYTGSAE